MDLSLFEQENSKNLALNSNPPTVCKEEPCMLGIDEAGRGPVLGPMVYAAAYCPISRLESLKKKGFADSKTLTEIQRNQLFNVIDESSDMVGWALEILSPNVISNSMLRRSKYNLNFLSHDSAIGLLHRVLSMGVNVKEVYVDTVGPPDKYETKLSAIFPGIKITVAKQADSTFPIVSAASICAKVARDNALKTWNFQEGDEFKDEAYGSGYPSDPVTKKFLNDNVDPVFGFPQIVRFSWSTADLILEKNAVKVSWDEEDTVSRNSSEALGLAKFLKKRKASVEKEKKAKKHSWFLKRSIQQTVSL